MKEILFIINPILEKKSGKDISSFISAFLDVSKFHYTIVYSEYPGHATEISTAGRNDFSVIVAVGGDGMVNEVAKGLVGSETVMGIIPIGSGNGLARTLRIPLSIADAIRLINAGNVRIIDMGLINNRPFFNMAGIGFDANVAHNYAGKKKRGFFTYMQAVIEKIFVYEASVYTIRMNSEIRQVKAFLISFANTSQWGYNAHVCPGANPSDGILGITIIRDFPGIILPVLFLLLFTKKLHKSRYVDIQETRSIDIGFSGEILGHVDGNPVVFSNSLHVEVIPHYIRVIAG